MKNADGYFGNICNYKHKTCIGYENLDIPIIIAPVEKSKTNN